MATRISQERAAGRSELVGIIQEIQAEGQRARSRLMALQDLGNPELHLVLDRKRGFLAGRGDRRQERATWPIVSIELPGKESTHTAWFLLDSEGIVREPGLYPLTEAWLTPNQPLNSYDFEGRDRKALARVLEGVRRLGT